MKLQHLQHDYHPVEDRIRLDGADAYGNTLRLWLTARLLNRAIPHLTGWLERNNLTRPALAAPAQTSSAERAGTPAHPQAVRSRPPQNAAEGADAMAAPVTHLVEGVAVQSRGDRMRLVFRNVDGVDVAELWLTGDELRRWLQLVYRIFLKADWPVATWPAWIAEQAAPRTTFLPPGSVAIH